MSRRSRILVGLAAIGLLALAAPSPTLHGAEEESRLRWQTYAGSPQDEDGSGVAVDASGNVYLTGWSDATWGSPILPHSGGRDTFVAKLDGDGRLLWNTFMGSSDTYENAIAVDGDGNVYAVGAASFGGGALEAFVAKLSPEGDLRWRRPANATYSGVATTVAVDAVGSIFVGGWGGCHSGPYHTPGAWVAKLDSSGADVWHSCVGAWFSECRTLVVDEGGNVYVAGRSTQTWGTPVNPHAGGGRTPGADDAFVAKLDSSGILQWNTFMGAPSFFDYGSGIAVDASGSVYVAGGSEATWGTPITRPAGRGGGFVAKVDGNGVRLWHTFLGTLGWSVAADRGQNVYAAGVWGAEAAGFVAALNRDGVLQWNTLVDAILDEMVLAGRHLYVSGQIDWPSGAPVHPHAGGWDAFVAKVEANPPPADFHTVTPCRLVDSRVGPPGPLPAGETRAIVAVGSCGIPTEAVALALNVTATQPTAPGNLRVYPTGQPRPLASTLNYSAGQTRANNAVAGLSAAGSLSVHCAQASGSVHFTVDVSGYFK